MFFLHCSNGSNIVIFAVQSRVISPSWTLQSYWERVSDFLNIVPLLYHHNGILTAKMLAVQHVLLCLTDGISTKKLTAMLPSSPSITALPCRTHTTHTHSSFRGLLIYTWVNVFEIYYFVSVYAYKSSNLLGSLVGQVSGPDERRLLLFSF